jgi:hypothetical protein
VVIWGQNTLVSGLQRGTAPAAGRTEVRGTVDSNYESADMIFYTCLDSQSEGVGGLGVLN